MGSSIAQMPAPPLLLPPQGTIGIGTQGNVGIWNGTGWDGGQSLMGGWTVKVVAFDRNGGQWCVGTEDNVGFWNGTGWTDYGTPGGWTQDWLYFS